MSETLLAMQNPQRLTERLQILKTERRAVILAHNYQPDEVQAVADHTGDSLELARLAARSDARVIVLAGVRFMAESAKLLAPDKTVLLPVAEAGCPLADTVTAEDVLAERARHPRAAVVSYVNSSAAVKAVSDVCCTSANAVDVVRGLAQDEVIFVPDKNLADWVARHTDKRIFPWAGSCCVHHRITVQDVAAGRASHPGAVFLAHPECRPEVCALADAVLSTSQMLRFVRDDPRAEFLIGTEIGLLYRLRQEHPAKRFHPLSERMLCRTMKMTTLAVLVSGLEHMRHAVELDPAVVVKARRAVERMVEVIPQR
ncbi:MAG: quinolinate synthase NadA [candidate division FCPU426 bacterium]